MSAAPDARALRRLVGAWTTEATHPALPGVVVRGTAEFAWLEGERFLTLRARTDHPDFPDSLSVIGHMGRDRAGDAGAAPSAADGPDGPDGPDGAPLGMHYFDSRGVFRVYETRVDGAAWRVWRDAPGFSQRFTGVLSADGDAIAGRWQLCEDDVHWADDVAITYRRRT